MKPAEAKLLLGERMLLRPFTKRDLGYTVMWSNDADLRKLTGETTPYEPSTSRKMVQEPALRQNPRLVHDCGGEG
jgi:hypothetical protein